MLNITEMEEGLFGYKFEKVDIADLAEEVIKITSKRRFNAA